MDLGGVPGARLPMGPNSFVFAYIFTKKCLCRRSTPPNGSMSPLREILDLPLVVLCIYGQLNVQLHGQCIIVTDGTD